MTKKVYLHIGHLKTGTTYLQHFCHSHADDLASLGVCFPDAGTTLKPGPEVPTGNHAVLALGLLLDKGLPVPKWYRAMRRKHPHRYDCRAQWEVATRQISQSPCSTALLSSEFFIGFASSPRAIQCLDIVAEHLASFDVTVVCYLRRPDRMIQSFYNEIVKTGGPVARLWGDVKRYRNTEFLDFVTALKPWVDRFGHDRVVVRNYDSLQAGDIVADFSTLIGSPALATLSAGENTGNPRLPNALIELKRIHNLLPGSAKTSVFLKAALSRLQQEFDIDANEEVSLLSHSDRVFLYRYTMQLNRRLQTLFQWHRERLFFSDLDSILESPASSSSDRDAAERFSGLLAMLVASAAASPQPDQTHHKNKTP